MGVDFWQAFVGVCIAGLQEVGDPDGVVRVFFGFYEDEVARSTTPARFAPPCRGLSLKLHSPHWKRLCSHKRITLLAKPERRHVAQRAKGPQRFRPRR